MSYSKLLEYSKRVAKEVDKFMLDEVLVGEPENLYQASTHLIRAGGKRLRPTLLILSSRLVGGNEEIAIPAAAAIEILHNFTLVHDDVMDMDEFRRGVPTVHKIWGIPVAIIAGDLLFSKAFEALLKLTDRNVSYDRIVKSAKILAKTASTIAEGQAMDMSFEERTDVTEEEYFKMIYRKTAALFEAATKIGAIIANAPENIVDALAEYGRKIGLAFQIQDDILGIVGEERKVGKPIGSDIREGKKTLIVIYALKRASQSEREELLDALGDRSISKEGISEIVELLEKLGAIDYAKEYAIKFSNEALNILDTIPTEDAEAKEMLKELAEYVIKRIK